MQYTSTALLAVTVIILWYISESIFVASFPIVCSFCECRSFDGDGQTVYTNRYKNCDLSLVMVYTTLHSSYRGSIESAGCSFPKKSSRKSFELSGFFRTQMLTYDTKHPEPGDYPCRNDDNWNKSLIMNPLIHSKRVTCVLAFSMFIRLPTSDSWLHLDLDEWQYQQYESNEIASRSLRIGSVQARDRIRIKSRTR